ncbi:hypothetical protein M9458_047261, partial [Cirrhinus mrigala]
MKNTCQTLLSFKDARVPRGATAAANLRARPSLGALKSVSRAADEATVTAVNVSASAALTGHR